MFDVVLVQAKYTIDAEPLRRGTARDRSDAGRRVTAWKRGHSDVGRRGVAPTRENSETEPLRRGTPRGRSDAGRRALKKQDHNRKDATGRHAYNNLVV